MSENIENKIELKDKLISYYNKNKIIFLIFFLIILIASTIFIFMEKNYEKKNNLISEKYIQAGLLLSSGNIEISKNIYEEIILSENKFYSILALNTILEKNLENDKNKVLNYFKILENIKNQRRCLILSLLKKHYI